MPPSVMRSARGLRDDQGSEASVPAGVAAQRPQVQWGWEAAGSRARKTSAESPLLPYASEVAHSSTLTIWCLSFHFIRGIPERRSREAPGVSSRTG